MRTKKLDYLLILVTFVLVAAVGIVAFMKSREKSRNATEFVVRRATLPSEELVDSSINLPPAGEIADREEEEQVSQPSLQENTKSAEESTEKIDLREAFDPGVAFGLDMGPKEPAALAALPAAAKAPDAPQQTTIEQISETINIPFDTEYQESDLLPLGEEAILQQGYDAVVEVDYAQTYQDGVLLDQQEIGRRYLASGQNHIIMVGTGESVADDEATEISDYSDYTDYTEFAEEPALSEEDLAAYYALYATEQEDSYQAAGTGVSVTFTSPGSNAAAETNFYAIAGLLGRNGAQTYVSYTDNGDGTITVDGNTFSVASGPQSFNTTSFDGYECYKQYPDPNAVNECNHTASGLLAQRGIVASSPGGFPLGTVLFIEGYGLAVVADRHGMGANHLDLSFDAREISQGIYLATGTRTVYVLN